MDEQLTLGEELRDRGMALAVSNTPDEFVHQVDLAIIRVRQDRPLFTAEDVRADLEAAYGSSWPQAVLDRTVSRIIGARMNAAGRRRLIRNTGSTVTAKRPEAHHRRLSVWVRGNA